MTLLTKVSVKVKNKTAVTLILLNSATLSHLPTSLNCSWISQKGTLDIQLLSSVTKPGILSSKLKRIELFWVCVECVSGG